MEHAQFRQKSVTCKTVAWLSAPLPDAAEEMGFLHQRQPVCLEGGKEEGGY